MYKYCYNICTTVFCLLFISVQLYGQETEADNIRQAIEKGCRFLESIQREDGAICDTVNPLFETWETVLSAKALYAVRKDTGWHSVSGALAFLRANENDFGLICHNRKCRMGYCLETTSEYLTWLLDMGWEREVRRRTDTIVSMQVQSGAWPIGNPDVREVTDFPSVTGFVLSLMDQAGRQVQFPRESLIWLSEKQQFDGQWGQSWEYYGTPAYALWPILKALSGNTDTLSLSMVRRAILYIRSNIHQDGSWSASGISGINKPSPALETIFMLLALSATVDFNDRSFVMPAINYLLKMQQVNGAWDGGYFPIDSKRYVKKEYVAATALAISVLEVFLQHHE